MTSTPTAPSASALTQAYDMRCTLTFGDIYGQILIRMMVIFVSLAAGLALLWRGAWGLARVGVAEMCAPAVLVDCRGPGHFDENALRIADEDCPGEGRAVFVSICLVWITHLLHK